MSETSIFFIVHQSWLNWAKLISLVHHLFGSSPVISPHQTNLSAFNRSQSLKYLKSSKSLKITDQSHDQASWCRCLILWLWPTFNNQPTNQLITRKYCFAAHHQMVVIFDDEKRYCSLDWDIASWRWRLLVCLRSFVRSGEKQFWLLLKSKRKLHHKVD